jgi:hypothetical protein
MKTNITTRSMDRKDTNEVTACSTTRAERLLRDVASVLHWTAKVKGELLAECPAQELASDRN